MGWSNVFLCYFQVSPPLPLGAQNLHILRYFINYLFELSCDVNERVFYVVCPMSSPNKL